MTRLLERSEYQPVRDTSGRTASLPPGWTFDHLDYWPVQPKMAGFRHDPNPSYSAAAHSPTGGFLSVSSPTPDGAIASLEAYAWRSAGPPRW